MDAKKRRQGPPNPIPPAPEAPPPPEDKDMKEWRASMEEWKAGETGVCQLLSDILTELKAIREQLKT